MFVTFVMYTTALQIDFILITFEKINEKPK